MTVVVSTEVQQPDDEITSWLSSFPDVILRQLAEDIEIAHRVNPKSWALTRTKGNSLCFFVGDIRVLCFSLMEGDFFVEADPNDPVFEDMEGAGRLYTSFARTLGFRFWTENLDTLIAMLNRHLAPHHTAIESLARKVKNRTIRALEHNPRLDVSLANVVGSRVVQPDYLMEIQLGPAIGQHNADTPRFWKISPGPEGVYWNQFRDRAVIAVHWSDEMVDLSGYPDAYSEFIARAKDDLNVGLQGARSLWNFVKVIKPGDLVLAYANQAVLDHGTVAGNYQLIDDDFAYMHRLPVNWESMEAKPIGTLSNALQSRLKTRATLFELKPEQYYEAIGESISAPAAPDAPSSNTPPIGLPTFPPESLSTVRQHFATSGLSYTNPQVATFVTALQTKGFVVLSGISGTGKSKIATGFVEMLPHPSASILAASDTTGFIPVTIKPYMRTYKRMILPSRQVDLLPPMPVDTQHDLTITLDDTRGDGRIEHRSHGSTAITVLYLRGQIAKNFANLDVGTQLYLQPVMSSDGEKIDRVELLRPEQVPPTEVSAESPPSNHLFLSVRPDWRDSTSLLGYYNPLTQTYEWTDFLKFILQAAENYKGPAADHIAWFVILDEMNLAHVEYYFADLLSVLESGRNSEGWTSQPLRTSYPDTIIEDEVPDREIFLPPNLYIIGTVNMDETTHAFSPKVLDRAFTIELTDVDFSNYPPSPQGTEGAGLDDDKRRALLSAFTREGRFHRIDKHEIASVVEDHRHPEIRTYLQSLNRELQRDRFHFGYRVFDEIAQYIVVNDETKLMSFAEAFDWAVFMKVLPKFSGSLARLRSPLTSLLAWAINPEQPNIPETTALVQTQFANSGLALSVIVNGATFPIVATRALQMLEALYTDGFVSFG